MHESCKEQSAAGGSDDASASDQSPEGAAKPGHETARRNRFADALLIVDPGAVNPERYRVRHHRRLPRRSGGRYRHARRRSSSADGHAACVDLPRR
jgi:hypothetical protein